jgi:adenosylcobinamide-GDP ribazoletransferase
MIIFRRVLAALRFLTALPVFGKGDTEPAELGRSMAYFPLAGMFIGLILSCAYFALSGILSSLFTSVLLVVLWACLSGFLHLEGFVDAVDGFSSGCEKDKILAVMKDHHCGAKGIIALVLLVALKIALVNEIFSPLRILAFLLVPAAGRWAMVCAAYFSPYARSTDGFGKAFVENCGLKEFILASAIFIAAGALLLKLQVFFLIVPLSVFVFIALSWLKMRIGGVTGDILGAINETCEILCLAAFLFVK